jgi:transcriptional regulator with XRE-family HTH domain
MSVNHPQEAVQLGQLLKQLRELAGFTGTELAAALRTSQSRVSRVESGGLGLSGDDLGRWLVKLGAGGAEAIEAGRLHAIIDGGKGRGGAPHSALPPDALEFRSALGVRISERRAGLLLTQADLAARIGVTRLTLTAYETGRQAPPPERLAALARELGVSADALLGLGPPAEAGASAEALQRAWEAGAAAAHRAAGELLAAADPPAAPFA